MLARLNLVCGWRLVAIQWLFSCSLRRSLSLPHHCCTIMAPRIANLSTRASRSTRPSALSSNLQMPHVFVVPPEEEQQDNPPWCCFDADEQPENNGDFPSHPDIDFLDVPYLLQQFERDTPAPTINRRTSVHQPRPRILISKKLEKTQRPEAVKIIENKPSQARQRDAWRDSDVVEVVKVKRGREAFTDLEENTNVKRSKTLKARATKALRSIKNVGKGSHRTHVKELWTSSESMPGIFKGVQEQIRSQQDQAEHHPPATSTKKGTLSRANSRSLSQIFQPAKPSRPGSSFTVRVAPSVALAEARRIPPTSSPSSLPHPRYNNTNLSLNGTDDALNRPISPSPSMKKNAKFSVRELHRLFSFSSSSLDEPSSAPTATTVPFASARSSSMARTSTSTLSSDYLDVPMEEGIYVDAHLLDLESAGRKSTSRYRQAFRTHHDDDFSTPRRLSELSLEMRLDSLHFDALSFDPEDFDVSMEGNILR